MTIRPTDILSDLRELADQLDIDLDEVDIHAASSLENDLGMDSLNLMDFLVFLEKKYSIAISDENLNDVETISDIVTVLNEVGSASAAGGDGSAADAAPDAAPATADADK